ncbi:MAG: hypothetical protein Q8M07_11750 [Prosthecobacter sp.]|nr:hypothetical protein [Prosthecobacter sp.]
MIYACLEARNAIEQLWFEIYILLKGGSIAKDEFERIKKRQDGWAAAIKELEPQYRKLTQFAAIVMKLDNRAPHGIVVWDFKKLRNIWNRLSSYCHAQGHVQPTIGNPNWVDQGLALVHEVYQYFSSQLQEAANGIMQPENMIPNARMIWEDFASDKIDEAQVEIRLRLVAPPN